MMAYRWLTAFTVWSSWMIVLSQNNDDLIRNLIQDANDHVEAENQLLETRFTQGVDRRVEDFTTIHSSMFEEVPEKAVHIEDKSRLINWIAFLIRRDNLNVNLQEVLQNTETPVQCPFDVPVQCPPVKYRSIDGTCNSLQRPLQGAAFTPFRRQLDPVYEEETANNGDIDDLPRKSGRWGPLPGARTISRIIHQQSSLRKTHAPMSFFFTTWGQFLAHTVTDRVIGSGIRVEETVHGPEETAVPHMYLTNHRTSPGYNRSKVDCCSKDLPSPQEECFSIDIPSGDPLRQTGRSCLPMQRSLEATDIQCTTGRREQLNAATSYIDASAVYGSTQERANFLRSFIGGNLSMSIPSELPYRSHPNALAEKEGYAFAHAGDARAPEVMPLLGMHTLWVREHNRIATTLASINPHWQDEVLYQEARRIVSAMIQHITYKEWLPPLLGNQLMRKYNLAVYRYGYYAGYDPYLDASTSNVMATAAFRFGHTLVASSYPLVSKDFSPQTSAALQLKDLFLKPNMYLLNEQAMTRGMLVEPSQPMDPFVTPQLANNLQETRPGNGADLVALNIQRGRDHGLPSYNTWRVAYNLTTDTTSGLPDIPPNTTQALSGIYSHPDDIDVWTGGVCENPVPDGLIGPLFGNILGQQFQRYKKGDRFWYETNIPAHRFTYGQLGSIRNTTLARVICNHFDLDTIQPEAFKLSSAEGNARVPCDTIPQLDLSKWRE